MLYGFEFYYVSNMNVRIERNVAVYSLSNHLENNHYLIIFFSFHMNESSFTVPRYCSHTLSYAENSSSVYLSKLDVLQNTYGKYFISFSGNIKKISICMLLGHNLRHRYIMYMWTAPNITAYFHITFDDPQM